MKDLKRILGPRFAIFLAASVLLASRLVNAAPVANGFDFPVGKPDGAGWNSDLDGHGWLDPADYGGDCGAAFHPGVDFHLNDTADDDEERLQPVYAAANGEVITSAWYSPAWGNIVLIEHTLPDNAKVWTQYAHLENRSVQSGDSVRKGTLIGTVGKGDGALPAHLHFEVRKNGPDEMPPSSFPCRQTRGFVESNYHDPVEFIRTHRKAPSQANVPAMPVGLKAE